MSAEFWIVQALNALQFSMLLFLLSIGLTVIFGLMHFVNLAHGVLYALGAYAGWTVARWTGSYWLAFVLAPVAVGLAGVAVYAGLVRRMRHAGHMNQVLVTFGLIFVFVDLFRIVWGDLALGVAEPALFSGRTELFGVVYPTYRLFVIGMGLAVMAALWLVLSRTPVGAMIRAGVDNETMAACLGVDVERLFFGVFVVGCALAGLAGIVAAPVLSVEPDMGTPILIPVLIVVVIGGLGSLRGAVAGALVVGFIQTFGVVLAPELASVLVYALLAAVLIFRPAGLFPRPRLTTMFRQTPLKSVAVAALLAGGIAYGLTAGYYGRELLTEVAILAILAIALDIVAGYGGMISLAHGALFGVGAYVFASATVLGGQGAGVGMLAAVAGVAAFGWAVGAVTARTHGIFFIMATLAFGQMAYVWIFESPLFGGDDGMFGIPRLDLSGIGLDLGDSRTFALVAVVLAALAYVAAAWLMRSGFGRTLVGIRANEARMRALGLNTWLHKANAFGLSGGLAGFAGALSAQHVQFISPGLMHWTVSGEALVVVILGGIGTLVGPVLGAAVFVFLKHEIQGLTDHWHLFVGLVLIAVVMSGGRGLYGSLEDRLARRRAARRPPQALRDDGAASPPAPANGEASPHA